MLSVIDYVMFAVSLFVLILNYSLQFVGLLMPNKLGINVATFSYNLLYVERSSTIYKLWILGFVIASPVVMVGMYWLPIVISVAIVIILESMIGYMLKIRPGHKKTLWDRTIMAENELLSARFEQFKQQAMSMSSLLNNKDPGADK